MSFRLIPSLLIERGRLVKTRAFADPTYIGDPINAVRIFNLKEVDELIVLDIAATKEKRGPDFALVEELASECFMPLAYGGGVRSVEDARRLFALGVEKVAVQSAALRDMTLIRQIADRFGEQAVVFAADVKKNWLGRPKLHSASGVKASDDWAAVLQAAVAAGAGEVMVTSVDREGRREGLDLDLIRAASGLVNVPLIAAGGAGSLADIKAAVDAGASAVAAGAFCVFRGSQRAVLITYPSQVELAMWG